MPFAEQLVPGGPWVLKTEIGLRQLRPRRLRFGHKTYFRILEGFTYVFPTDAGGPTSDIVPVPHLAVVQDDVTDLASVPPPLWGILASYGTHTMPALLHDRLCVVAAKQDRGGPALRRWADRHFRRMLRDEAKAGIATRWAMWAGVRLFSFVPLAAASVLWSGTVYASAGYLVRSGRLPRALAVASTGLGISVLVAATVRGFEQPLDFTEPTQAGADGPGAQPQPDPETRFSPAATASLLGAAGVGLVALPVIAPAAIVNVVAIGALRALDLLAKVMSVLTLEPLARLYRRLRPYPTPGTGGTSPGDDAADAVLDEPWPALATRVRRC